MGLSARAVAAAVAEPALFASYARMAADCLDVPLAAVAVMDGASLRPLGDVGFDPAEMPLAASLLMPLLQAGRLLTVPDMIEDARLCAHPQVTGGRRLRFASAAPLCLVDGRVIGFVAGFDTRPRTTGLTPSQERMLQGLASQLLAYIETHSRQQQARAALGSSEEQIRWATEHDPFTGLANRRLFAKRLGAAVQEAEAEQTSVGLLLFDLDRLKLTNDTLGHDAGDFLLRSFVQRLEEMQRDGETLARLGGDEFALIMPNLADGQQMLDRAQAVLARMRERLTFKGHMVECRASIGASLYPDHGRDANSLQRNADVALYRAKAQGRNCLVVFEPEMRSELQLRSSMISMARKALETDAIVPYYQPKFRLESGQLVGFEALLRWQHPSRGIQGPGHIAAALEDAELAESISIRMFERVIAQMRVWLDAGYEFGHVAVNAASAEFLRDGFAERVLGQLEAAGVPPWRLELEVTESVLLGTQAERADHILNLLNNAGVRIALDDFGTGFASLSHLKRFPVDTIKIDRSFVRDLDDDAFGSAIIRAVISLGQSLGISVVAEGIETEAQANFLRAHRCDVGQGFLLGRPADAAGLAGLLARSRAA
ncbi:putative bifunctional diguanylate cyclase/phosphodiesterase [Pedomonas sp. V897]